MAQTQNVSDLIGDMDVALDSLRDRFSAGTPVARAWPAIRKAVGSRLRAALDVDLLRLLAEGWTKVDLLRRDFIPAQERASTASQVTLAEHTQRIALDPDIHLTIDGIDACRLPIGLAIDVGITGAVLTIDGGAITEVELGELTLSAQLTYDGAELPIAMKTPQLKLVGLREIKPPIAI